MEQNNSEELKKAVFDSMSPRRQKHILKKGYERWDPFEKPKDPIDMRMDKTRRTSQMLIREFFYYMDATDRGLDSHGNDYRKGAFDLCLGIINEDEKFLGMFDFACWYQELLKKEGKTL